MAHQRHLDEAEAAAKAVEATELAKAKMERMHAWQTRRSSKHAHGLVDMSGDLDPEELSDMVIQIFEGS